MEVKVLFNNFDIAVGHWQWNNSSGETISLFAYIQLLPERPAWDWRFLLVLAFTGGPTSFGCKRQVCGQCGQYLGVTYSKEHWLGCHLLPFWLLIDFCWSDGPTEDGNQLYSADDQCPATRAVRTKDSDNRPLLWWWSTSTCWGNEPMKDANNWGLTSTLLLIGIVSSTHLMNSMPPKLSVHLSSWFSIQHHHFTTTTCHPVLNIWQRLSIPLRRCLICLKAVKTLSTLLTWLSWLRTIEVGAFS